MQRVRLDRSTSSVVIACDCGFRAITTDTPMVAAQIAVRHASAVHGDASQAIKVYCELRRRARAAVA